MNRLRLILAVVAILVLAVAVRENHWRSDKLLEVSAVSPSGDVLAEAYMLDEGGGASYGHGPAPYGFGVYLRRTYMPLKSFGSTLVFASYCGPEIQLRWVSSEALLIECKADKKPEILLTTYGGVKISYDAQGNNGKNHAL